MEIQCFKSSVCLLQGVSKQKFGAGMQVIIIMAKTAEETERLFLSVLSLKGWQR